MGVEMEGKSNESQSTSSLSLLSISKVAHTNLELTRDNLQFLFCKYSTSEKSDFKEHLDVIHREAYIGQNQAQCITEAKHYNYRKPDMINVIFKAHKINPIENKSFQCIYCDKTFSYQAELDSHVMIHAGEEPYKCANRDKAFVEKSAVEVHIRNHSVEKLYQCSYCEKAFQMKASLNRNWKKVHQCSRCDTAFLWKSKLDIHLMTHTPEKPYKSSLYDKIFLEKSKFKCIHCEEAFRDTCSLKIHMGRHTEEKTYFCNPCTKTFSNKNSFCIHMRGHTDEKLYQCNHCDEAFTERRLLKIHMITHNGETKGQDKAQFVPANIPSIKLEHEDVDIKEESIDEVTQSIKQEFER